MLKVYLLGGTLGGTLRWTQNDIARLAWADPTEISKGSIRLMKLAPDGETPGQPLGKTMLPGGPVAQYMESLRLLLESQQLEQHGYESSYWSYDWRKSIFAAGQRLADEINQVPAPELPVTIVGHSQGGLIARAAWRQAFLGGFSAKIRRIITIGTPHYGSAAAIEAMLGNDALIRTIVNTLQAGNNGFFGPIFYGTTTYTTEEIGAIIATWPAYYELMPFIGTPNVADPAVSLYYDAAKWPPAVGISQTWLTYARDQWQFAMKSAASLPPGNVMTCYVATGFPTTFFANFTPAGLLDPASTTSITQDGDSRVIAPQAFTSPAKLISLIGEHHSLLTHPGVLGTIIAEIIEERPIDPLPPPPVVVPQVYQGFDPTFPLDPIATIPQDPAVPQPPLCPGGVCTC